MHNLQVPYFVDVTLHLMLSHVAITANKIHCNQCLSAKTLVLRKLPAVTISFRQIRLNDIYCECFCGAPKLADALLNAVSDNACYQDHQSTV